MNWLEDRIRSAVLFTLGATLPFLGVVLAGLLGILLLILRVPFARIAVSLAGLFLLLNSIYGLRMVLKSFPMDPGRRLEAREAPALDELLRSAEWSWKGPRAPERVLAPDAWGVDLIGVPVAGIFGWCRFQWHIGIYPMLALSLREFEALVGWEMVFWSDYQGWFNLQVKRLATYWFRIHLHLEGVARKNPRQPSLHRLGTVFLRPYARWIVKAFQPFLTREFLRTDQAIAQSHGVSTLSRALCRMSVLKSRVTRRGFFPWDAALEGGEPLPEDLYRHLVEILGQEDEAGGMLDLALDGLQKEAPPFLRLRLEYLGSPAQVPTAPGTPVFGHLLEGTPVVEELHRGWRDRIQARSRQADQRHGEDALRFLDLAARLAGLFPTHPESAEYLALAFRHAPWDAFDGLLGMYRAAHPDDADAALFSIHRALQRGRDHAAVVEARELLGRNPLLAPACQEALAYHMGRRGDRLNSDKAWDRAIRAAAVVEKARRERQGASLVDPLESHRCGPTHLQEIQRLCLGDPRVQEAHLLRKSVLFHAERPVLLLVVRWRGAWWDPFGHKRLAFQRELQKACPFPPEATGFILVPRKAEFWMFGSKLKKLNGRIFSR